MAVGGLDALDAGDGVCIRWSEADHPVHAAEVWRAPSRSARSFTTAGVAGDGTTAGDTALGWASGCEAVGVWASRRRVALVGLSLTAAVSEASRAWPPRLRGRELPDSLSGSSGRLYRNAELPGRSIKV